MLTHNSPVLFWVSGFPRNPLLEHNLVLMLELHSRYLLFHTFFSLPVECKQKTFFFSACFASTLTLQDRTRAASCWPKFNPRHQLAAIATDTKQGLKVLIALLCFWPFKPSSPMLPSPHWIMQQHLIASQKLRISRPYLHHLTLKQSDLSLTEIYKSYVRSNPLILFYLTKLPLNDYIFLDAFFLLKLML